MKTAAIVSSLATAALACGQPVQQAPTQSGPFTLKLKSSDKSLDGKVLDACHSGAGIESLCIYDQGTSDFYFNTTSYSDPGLDGYSKGGYVIYNLPADPSTVSEALRFSYEPASNLAHPVFFPDYPIQEFSFSKDNKLVVIDNIDDTKNPPSFNNPKAYNRWYACTTYYGAYTYHTVDWALGDTKPQNPSCVKVDVVRHSK